VESHSLAGRDFDALPGSWIPPLACGPPRHIENAEAGDTDRLAGQEALENGVYHGLQESSPWKAELRSRAPPMAPPSATDFVISRNWRRISGLDMA